jgi:hypothetical protein
VSPLEKKMFCNPGIGIDKERKNETQPIDPTQPNKKPTRCQALIAERAKNFPAFHSNKKPESRHEENIQESGQTDFGNPPIPGISFCSSASLSG